MSVSAAKQMYYGPFVIPLIYLIAPQINMRTLDAWKAGIVQQDISVELPA
jgi:hypothetical protein